MVSKSNDSDLNIGMLLMTAIIVVLLYFEKENVKNPFNYDLKTSVLSNN
jgi:hypothetical protein